MARPLLALAALTLLAAAACAQPVNRFCPVGKEPIVPSAGTVAFQGKDIGLCCPGCGDQFLAWDETKKAEFVLLAMAGKEPGEAKPAPSTPATKPASIHPYSLDTCPVSGEKLGETAVTREYEGREVRFCCENCVAKYESDPAAHNAKIDEQTAARQRVGYPMNTCPISGQPLVKEGKFTGVEVVHKNRLVRFCCKNCAAKFEADPAPVLAKLDAAIIAAQADAYPMESCLVSNEAFEPDEKPIDVIYANRLYRLCCRFCAADFAKTPNKHAAALDAAYAKAQRDAITSCPISGENLSDSAVEVVAGTTLHRFCCKNCAGKFKADPDAYASRP